MELEIEEATTETKQAHARSSEREIERESHTEATTEKQMEQEQCRVKRTYKGKEHKRNQFGYGDADLFHNPILGTQAHTAGQFEFGRGRATGSVASAQLSPSLRAHNAQQLAVC